jgi:hypothetical protein
MSIDINNVPDNYIECSLRNGLYKNVSNHVDIYVYVNKPKFVIMFYDRHGSSCNANLLAIWTEHYEIIISFVDIYIKNLKTDTHMTSTNWHGTKLYHGDCYTEEFNSVYDHHDDYIIDINNTLDIETDKNITIKLLHKLYKLTKIRRIQQLDDFFDKSLLCAQHINAYTVII